METQIVPTVVGTAILALASIALYVWLLVSGTKGVFSPVSFRSERRWGYVAIFAGIILLAFFLGLFIALVWALLFGGVNVGLSVLIVYSVGMLTAVFYVALKQPRPAKTT